MSGFLNSLPPAHPTVINAIASTLATRPIRLGTTSSRCRRQRAIVTRAAGIAPDAVAFDGDAEVIALRPTIATLLATGYGVDCEVRPPASTIWCEFFSHHLPDDVKG